VQHETMRRPAVHCIQAFHISTRPSAVTLCAAEDDGWVQTNAETTDMHVILRQLEPNGITACPDGRSEIGHPYVHPCVCARRMCVCMRVCKGGSDILIGGAKASRFGEMRTAMVWLCRAARRPRAQGSGNACGQGWWQPNPRSSSARADRERQTADEDQHLHGSGAQTATVMDRSVVHVAGDTGSSHHCAGGSWLEYEVLSLILIFEGIMYGCGAAGMDGCGATGGEGGGVGAGPAGGDLGANERTSAG